MKIPVACMQCIKDHLIVKSFPMINNVNEEDIYEITCEHGHKSYVYIQNEKFDILFTLAIQALSDGYYREAILNFTSALERFYEFGIRLLLLINEVPQNEINTLCKKVLKQSEKELGAYATLYLLTRKVPANLLSDKDRSFRNKVVHMGVTPKYSTVLDYGNKIHEIIKNEYKFFEDTYSHEIVKLTLNRAKNLKRPKNTHLSCCAISSFIKSDLDIEEMVQFQKDGDNISTELENFEPISFD